MALKQPTYDDLLALRQEEGCPIKYARTIWWRRELAEELQRPDCDMRAVLLVVITEFL